MLEPVNWAMLIVMFLVYAALTVGVLVLLRVLWMWLFGASAVVSELQQLRAEVRALKDTLERRPAIPPTNGPAPAQPPQPRPVAANSGRISNTGWGDDDAIARTMRYTD